MIDSDNRYFTFVVRNKVGRYIMPQFRIDTEEDPSLKVRLESYQTDENYDLEIRETFSYYGLSADSALEIGNTHPDYLFRFVDDAESVTLHSSIDFCEIIQWSEDNPDMSTAEGYYSFFMDRILSSEEQEEYIKTL